MASLFVIQGTDQGKRFELKGRAVGLGRENSNAIRLNDNEVSRRHAEVRPLDDGFELVDLGSANGTFVNGLPIQKSVLSSGDQVRLGQTLMLFDDAAGEAVREVTARVQMLSPASPDDRSAILRSIPVDEGSKVLNAPGIAGGAWLKDRLVNLSVMYKATQAISHVVEIDALLPQILQLVFESIGADRGAILLKTESADLIPKAVKWRDPDHPEERMSISRSIIDHVLTQKQGVLTSDAPKDERFSAGQSIIDFGIREAVCVPVQGRHGTLGVIYADVLSTPEFNRAGSLKHRLNQDHLMLMVAIGHQAGLAIENTELYQAKIQAERLAAVGQTIATLSHHIKNILQGIKGGSYLIDMGLNSKDDAVVRRGWSIVEKNQGKIYNLVMDMLSFSKDREPALEPSDINETIGDVVELMQSRADELNVTLKYEPGSNLPEVMIDPDGIHRAILNIVTNAIDAAEEVDGATVRVSTSHDQTRGVVLVTVADNGTGIPEEHLDAIFQIFESSKGSRGTGLGLPVSKKIIAEHGGKILVRSQPGQGTVFEVELPLRRGEGLAATGEFHVRS